MQTQTLFDSTKTEDKKGYFVYNDYKFKPFRKFTNLENNCWLEIAKNFDGEVFIGKNWNYDLFYQQAAIINASDIDVFEMTSNEITFLVVPTSGRLVIIKK